MYFATLLSLGIFVTPRPHLSAMSHHRNTRLRFAAITSSADHPSAQNPSHPAP